MNFVIDDRILKLVTGPVYWFADSADPAKLIRDYVASNLLGVYCLWWKDPRKLPKAPRVQLPAGGRGKLSVELKYHAHGLCNHAAMYVGKGLVRTRLASHIKPAPESKRNPYWWMMQIVKDVDGSESIRRHLGFSYFDEQNSVEQAYAENLAIGILRPWFNFRFTA